MDVTSAPAPFAPTHEKDHQRSPRGFARLSLVRQFALVGSLVALAGMAVTGNWVANAIQASVVRNSAISSAVYMESFIAPLSQELVANADFRPDTVARMQSVLSSPPLSDRIVSVKIWREGGRLAYSSDAALIGQVFAPSSSLTKAWEGNLSASFDSLDEAENKAEQDTGVPLLEVYNPIHSILTGEVIAVAEFYLDATELESDLRWARLQSWGVVSLVSCLTFAALFGIVKAGSRTIADQRRALEARYHDLSRISAQNVALRLRVEGASRRLSEMSEQGMRRISAELHDGPAQALAVASLRLESLTRRANLPPDDSEALSLRAALVDALRDIRHICQGLSLPELRGRTLRDTLEAATGAHERRTGATVQRWPDPGMWPELPAPHPTLICLYRFVQEGLMNAYRHAQGAEVAVVCLVGDGQITVSVSDRGPGFDAAAATEGLGLAGLRERIESIGGRFSIDSRKGEGTRITVHLSQEGVT